MYESMRKFMFSGTILVSVLHVFTYITNGDGLGGTGRKKGVGNRGCQISRQ